MTDLSAPNQSTPLTPERIRLSLRGIRAQVDVSLPLDVPVAGLIPILTVLFRPDGEAQSDATAEASAGESTSEVWVLRRDDVDTPLASDTTLRAAGLVDGGTLRLTSTPALSGPMLYDDVVDATATLNKTVHAGWDASAARAMAFAGIAAVSATWAYLVLAHQFSQNRSALAGMALLWALALVGGACLAVRAFEEAEIGVALGSAALPITGAVVWEAASGLAAYRPLTFCGLMMVLVYLLMRVIRKRYWAHLAAGVVLALAMVAVSVSLAGVRRDLVGIGLSVTAVATCAALGRMSTTFRWFTFARRAEKRSPAADRPDDPAQLAQAVWERRQSAKVARWGLRVGLAVSTALGAVWLLWPTLPVRWSDLAFAALCTAILTSHAQGVSARPERISLNLVAAALGVFTCWRAHDGTAVMRLTAFGVALTASALIVLITARDRSDERLDWIGQILPHSMYFSVALLIPSVAWVVRTHGGVII
ncbi:EsaB/YukD family protein [Mycobacterium sp. 3519A]|uniref:EsaB/YukD family protein n=1 Tax=Mycobacterium sp. 3519A TaxID=2057184 RepID=UPI000C7A9848|nr:EsaB/YukD family protein [Mycobacterium sp. 3519A]